jgi:hypothetical protein
MKWIKASDSYPIQGNSASLLGVICRCITDKVLVQNIQDYSDKFIQREIEWLDESNKDIITVLNHLKLDAEMALSGEWDVTQGNKDIEAGFEAQLILIDELLGKLN